MKLFLMIILFVGILPSCSILRNLNKYQSDKQFKRTEVENLGGDKCRTQWWYFDCFFEDGSVLVFLFTPHQWWDENGSTDPQKSLLYVSYMYPDGEVASEQKIFSFNELSYHESTIISPNFKISRSSPGKAKSYKIDFSLTEIKGEMAIDSRSKGFSPLPTGSMGKLATRHILKLKGKGLAFRYAAHVPEGRVDCSLAINGKKVLLTGKAYHEQGCFTGSPAEMGKGWNWFHFVSENLNIFGKPGDFLCLEKDGKRLIGGISFKEYELLDRRFSYEPKKFISGGNIKFTSKNHSFEISPIGVSTPLIIIPSSTKQIWTTSLQPSILKLNIKGNEFIQEGFLLLETCKMAE